MPLTPIRIDNVLTGAVLKDQVRDITRIVADVQVNCIVVDLIALRISGTCHKESQ